MWDQRISRRCQWHHKNRLDPLAPRFRFASAGLSPSWPLSSVLASVLQAAGRLMHQLFELLL